MEGTLSYGQKRVGLSFNPSGIQSVNSIKEKAAALIDALHEESQLTIDVDAKGFFKHAIELVVDAQMNGVKAATWK